MHTRHLLTAAIALLTTSTAFGLPTYTIADEDLYIQVQNQRELPPLEAVLDPQSLPVQPSLDPNSAKPDGVNVFDPYAEVLEIPH